MHSMRAQKAAIWVEQKTGSCCMCRSRGSYALYAPTAWCMPRPSIPNNADSLMSFCCAHPFPAACHMSTKQNTTAFLTSGRECWKAANSPGSSCSGATASRSAGRICLHTSCNGKGSRQTAQGQYSHCNCRAEISAHTHPWSYSTMLCC